MKSISKKRFVNFILIIAFIFAFSDYKFSQNVNPCVNLVGKEKTEQVCMTFTSVITGVG